MKREWLVGLCLLSPAILLIVVFRLLPIAYSLRMSLFDWGLAGPVRWVFLNNYLELLRDPKFLTALINTFYYSIGVVPLTMAGALMFALLLNRPFPARGLFRTLYYLPVVASIVAISVVWRWLYNPDRGLLNLFLKIAGLGTSQFLNESNGVFAFVFGPNSVFAGPSIALCCIILMSIWKELGYGIIIYLAGLQSIPGQYYEAARIDGAGRLRTFFRITLPLLSPTTFYVLIIMTITSFNVFGPIYVMTGPPPGGPLSTTNVVVHFLYEESFKMWKLGYGSAIAFVLFVIIFILTRLQKVLVEKRVHYE